jgi:murein L,D-transpeptidase YcbB/YkuD
VRSILPLLVVAATLAACSSSRPSTDGGSRASRVEAPQAPAAEPAPATETGSAPQPAPPVGALGAPLRQRVEAETAYRKAMLASLEARGFEPFFTTPSGPTAAIEALTGAIQALPGQGLVIEKYPLQALSAAVEAMRAGADPSKSRVELEVLAMSAFFRYAMDLKYLPVAHPFKAARNPAKVEAARHDDLVKAFEDFARDPKAGLEALAPRHPYYAALVQGLARYRALASGGDFPTVPAFKGKLKKGARGPVFKALKARLAAEGYFEGDAENPVFNSTLEDAWKDYQGTHGYDPTGEVEDRHLKSLNVAAAQRAKQIELSLQRWRESEVRPDEPLYVRVNIPEFKMEVWDEGSLKFKHKIVCGNNNWDKDVDNRLEGRINRTKIFTAEILRIIVNPKWHVPARIQKEELDWEVLKEPDYFARHNFKVKVLPDGREEVYQDSGTDNALGRVKFVFPNPYGIFMHDTNLKEFFKREYRAFSHGCIRLHEPREVADFLLERCGGVTPERIEALFGQKEQREIELEKKVPIFVEYNTVGVDEKGRMQFFSDVYGYDKDFFDGKIPYSEEELRLLTRKIPKVD